jgi:uncharacterized OB-fold protein
MRRPHFREEIDMEKNHYSNTEFNQLLKEGKLMGVRCKDCESLYLPPRPMCTSCHSSEMVWMEMPLKGHLAAFTTIHIAPTAMIEAGYGRDNPYCSGIVELENGLSISAQILGVDANQPGEIEIGTPVKAEFIKRGEGEEARAFLAFRAE